MNPPPPPTSEILSPLKKSIHLPLSVEDAFHLFTAGFARWWPLATHSVGLHEARTCLLEPHPGGRIYEILLDGRQFDWGRILVWEPPARLVFTWHPGREPDTAQEVEVRFLPESGGARLELTHTGWERLGDRALDVRQNYDTGWDYVLGQYAGQGSTAAGLGPIVRSVWVDLPLDAAFHLFTADTGRWWPLATHSVAGEDAAACFLEGFVGGRFYEVDRRGSQSEWGRLTAWDPPRRLACSFYPGRTPEFATHLEIRFEPESTGTRVTLAHHGWEILGPTAPAERQGYARGWELILDRYRLQAAS